MTDYLTVIFFSLIGGLLSLIGALLLISRKNITNSLAKYATPFAAGALLAAVFMDLLPEGLEQENSKQVLYAALIGIIIFFIAERFLRWFHHHHEDDDKQRKDPLISLIVAGDTLHNALDGVAIAAAFLVSVPTGIVTTIAVAAHEIPQEIGDFTLLLSKGMRRRQAILVNVLSALATTVTAVITFSLGSDDKLPLGFLFGLSAGFLLYIALSDVIPTIHAKPAASKLVQIQTILLLLGIAVVGASVQLAHNYIESAPAADSSSTVEQLEHGDNDHSHADEH